LPFDGKFVRPEGAQSSLRKEPEGVFTDGQAETI